MPVQVKWTAQATKAITQIINWGKLNFSEQTIARLFYKIISYETPLTNNPYMGALEPLLAGRKLPYRSLVIHEHYKLIYYVDEKKERLYISDVWDTRRKPMTLTKRIRTK